MNLNLTELIGPNWRTSLLGLLSKLFLAFMLASVFQPDLIYGIFGKGAFGETAKAIGLFGWFAFGAAKDFHTKDKQVAGNNPESVVEGNVQTKVAK